MTQDLVACGQRPATIEGLDVSYHDGAIDWPRVRAAGIDFAFIRTSDGLQFPDPAFADHWADARAAGVIRGAYQFFRPAQDPIAQAEDLLARMGPLEAGDLPPVIDVEVSSGLAPAAVEASVRVWIDHVTAAIGRPPIIYAGLYSWHDLTGNADLTTSPLWLAQWTTAACPDIPAPWQRWMFWQYTASGIVDGIGETVDVNRYDGTRDELLAFAVGGMCGDGTCNAGETPATCDADCAPCGTVGALGATIDDGDDCFALGGDTRFLRAVTDSGEGGDLVWTHTTASDTETNFAEWTLYLEDAGLYSIDVYTARDHARSRQAAYVIQTGTARTTVVIDQQAVDGWQPLGNFALARGGGQWIHLADNTGEPGADDVELAFDAVRLTRLDPPDDEDPPGDDDGGGMAYAGCSAGGGVGLPLVLLLLLALSRRRHGFS